MTIIAFVDEDCDDGDTDDDDCNNDDEGDDDEDILDCGCFKPNVKKLLVVIA